MSTNSPSGMRWTFPGVGVGAGRGEWLGAELEGSFRDVGAAMLRGRL